MSNQDDPFGTAQPDHTVIMPTPGRRAAPAQAGTGAGRQSYAPADPAAVLAGVNPLVAAANPLLDIVPQLRTMAHHPDPRALREDLAANIKTFEARAKEAGVAPEKVIAARYCLCTLLDETAASTPWGGSGGWANLSLLVMFHNEVFGGEKFFQLLSKLAEKPAENRDLLELMYACLALGFQGRYRVIENGQQQLEALRERLAQILRKISGEYERDLSGQWRGATVQRSRMFAVLPLWVAWAACGLVLLGAFLFFQRRLNAQSDPVRADIESIRIKAPIPQAPPPPAAKPRLAGFLAKEIQEGLVAVRDDATKSVVTIRGDGLFAPGSATIRQEYEPLLARIANALAGVPGKVVVAGHTDNVPIRTVRFPSNWHLSQDRARSVAQLLGEKVPTARLSAEGRAEAEPIGDNATPEGRRKNRRVEITLFVEPGKG